MLRKGAWCDLVFDVARASCSILFCNEGCKTTFTSVDRPSAEAADLDAIVKGNPFKPLDTTPDHGNLAMEDSRMSDGCPNMRLMYPQVTREPSLLAHKSRFIV